MMDMNPVISQISVKINGQVLFKSRCPYCRDNHFHSIGNLHRELIRLEDKQFWTHCKSGLLLIYEPYFVGYPSFRLEGVDTDSTNIRRRLMEYVDYHLLPKLPSNIFYDARNKVEQVEQVDE